LYNGNNKANLEGDNNNKSRFLSKERMLVSSQVLVELLDLIVQFEFPDIAQ
jgi:hypothetical protein